MLPVTDTRQTWETNLGRFVNACYHIRYSVLSLFATLLPLDVDLFPLSIVQRSVISYST
jgi:hypothetical protein